MSVQIVRFGTDAGRIPEVEAAVGRLFAALEEAAPAGMEYTAEWAGSPVPPQPATVLGRYPR